MWSPNEIMRRPKYENEESNVWHTYSSATKYGIINAFFAGLLILQYYWQYFYKYRLDIGNTFSEKYCK